ncbi:MAG: DUF2231 domain-containing protein [Hyphomicrobiaceae bacterium]
MRIGRHPLHPMLVHFPIALWSLSTICDIGALLGTWKLWNYACSFLVLGLVMALPAMAVGFFDLARLKKSARQDGDRHMLLMCAAWVSYFAALGMRLENKAMVTEPQAVAIAFGGVGFCLMAFGGWYGGKLVYHHGAGVRQTQRT